MIPEFKLTNEFIAFLQAQKGFPLESLVREMSVGNRLRADIVVIDPETKDPLIIFELKTNFDQNKSDSAIAQLNRYKTSMGQPDLPSFIVTDHDQNGFRIYSVGEKGLAIVMPEAFPGFLSFQNRIGAEKKTQVKAETRKTIDRFKISCYLCAVIVAVFLTLDLFKLFTFTAQQITLLGVIVALIVMPYAAKLKVLGVEFERHKPNEKL